MSGEVATIRQFFAGRPDSRRLYEEVRRLIRRMGPSSIRVSKSQIAIRRRRAFCWLWIPDRYLDGGHAPLVLTLAFRRKDRCRRWKSIVRPGSGTYVHHLELWTIADVDAQVLRWLRRARSEAAVKV